MKSNRGGVREGAGRKPSNKQTVVVRVPVELLPMIEDAKLGAPSATNLQSVTEIELINELERRGFEVSIYVEPHPASRAARTKKKKDQKKAIEQKEENTRFKELFGNNSAEELGKKFLDNMMTKYNG